jgi:tetratricopeptide (TPR) repeat protein
MKNLLLLFLTFSLVTGKMLAQADKKIDNIMFLFVDEKYEDVVYKSENLMQNDKYKRHPSIYLYAAKGYYEMSRQPGKFDVGEKESKYPKPLRMAQKYLYKYIKAELKVKKYFPDYNGAVEDNKDFFIAIADTSNKLGQLLYAMEKPRKAASAYKSAFKAVPMDPVLQLWQGIGEVKSKNTVEGDKNIKAALKVIDENFEPSKATSGVLAHGMLIVEEYLRTKGDYANADKAKKLIEVFKKYDPDELDKKKMEERKEKMKKEVEDDEVMRKFFSDENDEDNKNKKGKVIIKDGRGSDGGGKEDIDEELDKLEKEETGG